MSSNLRAPAGRRAIGADMWDSDSADGGENGGSDGTDVSMHDGPMRYRSCLASGTTALALVALLAFAAALAGSRDPSSVGRVASLQEAPADCEEYGGKTVILVTTSVDFNDMFTNWLYYARPFIDDKTQQIVVLAHDEESVQTLGELAANLSAPSFVVIDVESLDSGENVRRLADYNTSEYGAIVTQRSQLMLHFLNLGCDVLYSDIDMVWLKDPMAPILAGEPHDLYFASDDKHGKFKNFCSCFIYARPSNTTMSFMTRWADLNRGKTRNQPDFNEAMLLDNKKRHESLRLQNFSVLPQSDHPPGCLADNFSDPAVLHANYVEGKKKKAQFFKDRNIWHPNMIYKS